MVPTLAPVAGGPDNNTLPVFAVAPELEDMAAMAALRGMNPVISLLHYVMCRYVYLNNN